MHRIFDFSIYDRFVFKQGNERVKEQAEMLIRKGEEECVKLMEESASMAQKMKELECDTQTLVERLTFLQNYQVVE